MGPRGLAANLDAADLCSRVSRVRKNRITFYIDREVIGVEVRKDDS
jgi:hypothetical protein